MNAVISCPRCLRQYPAELPVNGKVGHCMVCKAHFAISVTTLGPEAHDAIDFDDPIQPSYNFFMEACSVLHMHVRTMLRLAGEEQSPFLVIHFIKTLPLRPEQLADERWRESYCNQVMQKAFISAGIADQEFSSAFHYIAHQFPLRDIDANLMIQGAFLGILEGMPWPESRLLDPKPEPERQAGPLERWFARRGL
jgi:hypothetical protein